LPIVRRSLLYLAALAILIASAGDASQARSRRHHHSENSGGSGGYHPPYAAIVVDANSGRVLYASNPDGLRHPASITKVMTLYLLFEQLEAGKLRLDTRLPVSAHAAAQEPSKLGLEPGQTISTEDAIKAVVTKSANDIAVVIAEAIAGNEPDFARLMTRKAHALGMTRTVYMNASGLPDDEQVTTARDQALLGRAIQDRFPRFYRYFATSTFHFHGLDIRNHNHLLGRVQGVDGIKTGYTHASGFNLLSSVRRGNRRIVAAVFGGASSGARDARMRDLIEAHIAHAAPERTVPMVAEAIDTEASQPRTRVAAADSAARIGTAETAPRAATREAAIRSDPSGALTNAPRSGSAEPIQPIPVKTIPVRSRAVQNGTLGALVISPSPATALPYWTPSNADPAGETHRVTAASEVAAAAVSAAANSPAGAATPLPPPPGARPGILGTLPVHSAVAAKDPTPASATLPATVGEQRTAASRGGWIIQLGAFADEAEAKQRLRSAQSMAHELLANAEGFTERFVKGSKEFYRARFAGFDKEKAEAACHYFKRNDIACMTLRN
jgi:D-alanyl-D-alanine carboxypeptidase